MPSPITADTFVPTVTTEPDSLSQLERANQTVRASTYWAMGVGVIPVPLLDLAGIAGFQLRMLNKLSQLYGIKFSEHAAKNIIAALIGSLGIPALATGAIASFIKIIPLIGTVGGVVALPIVAGASTFAVGKVFIQHFESGGTFLDFDPEKTKKYFAQQFAEGKKVAATEAKSHAK